MPIDFGWTPSPQYLQSADDDIPAELRALLPPPRQRPAPVNFPVGTGRPQTTLIIPQPAAAITGPPNDPSLPPPQFGIASAGPSSFDRARDSLAGAMTGGTSAFGAAPAVSAGLQGSQGPRLPTIFNAGGQSSPDIAIPATSGTPPGPGYRRTISADGGPTYWQTVRPEERGTNGQDLLRQGTSMAEIIAAHPGWSATQQLNLYRQGQQDAAQAARQNFTIGNESANRNAGIVSNADNVAAQNAAARTTEANTGATHERNQLPSAVILQGGGPQEVADAMEALRAGTAPAGGAAPGNAGTGAVTGPSSALHRLLDQHLQAAAGIAPQQGAGPRIPVSLPAATGREAANKAITNFVHSVGGAGLLTPENLPAVMAYMTQRMRASNVDPWFAERFGGLSGSGIQGHQEAVNKLEDVMRRRGVEIGNTQRPLRIGGTIGSIGQGIRSLFGG